MEHPGDDPDEGPALAESLDDDDLFGVRMAARLDRFVADARAEQAAARRRREHWLQRQANDEASLVGVLVDLAERGDAVAVHARAGRVHHGCIEVVGADFILLGRGELPCVVVALTAVSAVTTQSGTPIATGARKVVAVRTLAQLVEGLCGGRERVTLVVDDGRYTVTGTLWSLGQDVVTVRLDSATVADRRTAYLPLVAISELVLA